jgi:hypothetical protein
MKATLYVAIVFLHLLATLLELESALYFPFFCSFIKGTPPKSRRNVLGQRENRRRRTKKKVLYETSSRKYTYSAMQILSADELATPRSTRKRALMLLI